MCVPAHMCESPESMFGWKMHNLNFQRLNSSDFKTNLKVIIAFSSGSMKLERNDSFT